MAKEIKARQAQKIDTAENWLKATGFTPMAGEILIVSDHEYLVVIGDGTKTAAALVEYAINHNIVIRSDWAQEDPDAPDYILNKPSIATDDEVMELLFSKNVVTPISDSTGYTYLDQDQKILTM